MLRDGKGTQPARISRSASGVLFNWSDLRLETRAEVPQSYEQGYPQNYTQSYPPTQNPTGHFLQDLFNSMFR